MLMTVLPMRLGRGVVSLLSHAGDDAAKATLVVAQCRYRVMLATVLPRRRWL
jgi:hypothetical protein